MEYLDGRLALLRSAVRAHEQKEREILRQSTLEGESTPMSDEELRVHVDVDGGFKTGSAQREILESLMQTFASNPAINNSTSVLTRRLSERGSVPLETQVKHHCAVHAAAGRTATSVSRLNTAHGVAIRSRHHAAFSSRAAVFE